MRVILGETLEVCITLCDISKAPCSLFVWACKWSHETDRVARFKVLYL